MNHGTMTGMAMQARNHDMQRINVTQAGQLRKMRHNNRDREYTPPPVICMLTRIKDSMIFGWWEGRRRQDEYMRSKQKMTSDPAVAAKHKICPG